MGAGHHLRLADHHRGERCEEHRRALRRL